MNTDRFLTRVFDTQEKKMFYPGDKFKFDVRTFTFAGVDNGRILVEEAGEYICLVDFPDRFVLMMCSGATTNNTNKLLYESDIVKHNGSLAIIKWNLYEGLYLESLNYEDAYKFHSTAFVSCSYIGNKWENPELLEVKA